MSGAPETVYCLRCRSHQKVVSPVLGATEFKSKKTNAAMSRQRWSGTCEKCQKSVSRWAKTEKKEVAPVELAKVEEKDLAPPPAKIVKVEEVVAAPAPEPPKAL
jgi:hypothetical protein